MKFYRFIIIILIFISTTSTVLSQRKLLTVDEIYTNRDIVDKRLSMMQWHSGGDRFSYVKFDPADAIYKIYSHDVETGDEVLVLTGDDLKLNENDDPFIIRNYSWSPDERYILFTETLPARRLKTGGAFHLYDFKENKFFLCASSDKQQVNIEFSPDGKKIGFVRENDLYIYDIESGTEKRLTFDGSENVLNGVFDWVYEEEFSIIKAWQWSPDSRSIAFWRLDQSAVPEIKIAKWDSLYFNFLDMRYPKAGDRNADVKIGVVDIISGETRWMDIGNEPDIYIARINFTPDAKFLSMQRLNRLQNRLELLFADPLTGKSEIIYTDTDPAWISVTNDLVFMKQKEQFIITSEKDGFRHIYIYDFKGNEIRQLTSGEWEVSSITGFDENTGTVFYHSNERGTIYQDVYSIRVDGSGKQRLSDRKGNNVSDVSVNGKYYMLTNSSANKNSEITLHHASGEKLRDIIINDMSVFNEYGLSELKFTSFTTTDGVTLNASMILPPDFDESKKYPVLIHQYSGPGSQRVIDRWELTNYLWHQMLAQKGYIIFIVDNRGTGGRGKEFKNIVYKNLGYWEVNDMVESAKYLSNQEFVDSERIGIWGWSYGGYVAALAITKAAEYFKAAISVAPVTHWKFYDTIYTERFMQTPVLNPEGYENSTPLKYTDNYKGGLLLVHGTADDNVHVQNAMVLAADLISKNKHFESVYYPEKDHSIRGGKARQHLYNYMTDFILRNL